jgi:predicted GNAT family acetyltransferase
MYRKANINDLNRIIKLKIQMHIEGGYFDVLRNDAEEFIMQTYKSLYENNKAQHFIFEIQSKIISCAGGFIKSEMPYSFRKTPFYGYISDVYTTFENRNQGYASLLTKQVISWLHNTGVKDIRLMATDQSRKIYERIGFISTDEMILSID